MKAHMNMRNVQSFLWYASIFLLLLECSELSCATEGGFLTWDMCAYVCVCVCVCGGGGGGVMR